MMLPLVARSSPATRFSRVDFPLPDGPMMAVTSPAGTSSDTASRAGRLAAAYSLVTPLIATRLVMCSSFDWSDVVGHPGGQRPKVGCQRSYSPYGGPS